MDCVRWLFMATTISHSPADTEALGQAWGEAAQKGLIIALCGDLGAGKTQLVKGVARGLLIAARVHSPTFSIVNSYKGGRLPLFHLDLYRLETRAQIEQAGLEEYLEPAGVTVIEWADRWFPRGDMFLAADRGEKRLGTSWRGERLRVRWVAIEIQSETDRQIVYEDFGA
jgi:tRNA threonylcarbamoyladenosine biosynthesis protein TsaE